MPLQGAAAQGSECGQVIANSLGSTCSDTASPGEVPFPSRGVIRSCGQAGGQYSFLWGTGAGWSYLVVVGRATLQFALSYWLEWRWQSLSLGAPALTPCDCGFSCDAQ